MHPPLAKPLVSSGTPTVQASAFADFADWYTARHRRSKGRLPAASTVKGKCSKLAALWNFTSEYRGTPGSEPFGDPLVEILGQRQALETLIDRLLTRQVSGTVRQAVYALADYGDYLVAKGVLACHVVTKADVPPENPPPPIVTYTDAEMRLLVDAARGVSLRWWALMATLADTGRRIGELLAFQWSWFRLDASPAHVQLPTSKNGDQHYIPLTKRLREQVFVPSVIDRLRSETPASNRRFVHDPLTHPFPWDYSSVVKRFQRHCEKLDIDYRGLHNLRHTVVTSRLAAGVPPQAVSALAGHRSLATTMSRYHHATSLDYWKFIEPPESAAG